MLAGRGSCRLAQVDLEIRRLHAGAHGQRRRTGGSCVRIEGSQFGKTA